MFPEVNNMLFCNFPIKKNKILVLFTFMCKSKLSQYFSISFNDACRSLGFSASITVLSAYIKFKVCHNFLIKMFFLDLFSMFFKPSHLRDIKDFRYCKYREEKQRKMFSLPNANVIGERI